MKGIKIPIHIKYSHRRMANKKASQKTIIYKAFYR